MCECRNDEFRLRRVFASSKRSHARIALRRRLSTQQYQKRWRRVPSENSFSSWSRLILASKKKRGSPDVGPRSAYYSRRRSDVAAIPTPRLRCTQCMRDIRPFPSRVRVYLRILLKINSSPLLKTSVASNSRFSTPSELISRNIPH